MEDYYFLYKNQMNEWHEARNLVFIAAHQYCRAIPRKEIKELGFDSIEAFIHMLNNNESFKSKKVIIVIKAFDLF